MVTPIWISVAVGIAWSLANALWSVFLVRMENRLVREFVSQAQCREHRSEMERRLVQVGA